MFLFIGDKGVFESKRRLIVVVFWTHKAVYCLLFFGWVMMPIMFKCPICQAVLADPSELREHRLSKHKNCVHEAKCVC
jgi:hypothetical protein